MIIATGTGRCGTKTISEMFYMVHEYHIRDLIHPWYWHGTYQGNPWPGQEDRLELLRQHLDGLYLPAFRCSNNIFIHFIRELPMCCLHFRCVLLVRDLREFCRSAISRNWHKRQIWSMRPDPASPEGEQWESYTPIQKTAWIWTWRNRLALKSLKAVPPACSMVVHTHQLYDRAEEIAAFYGVVPNMKAIKGRQVYNARGHSFPAPEEWTPQQDRQAFDIAGDLPGELGFE